MTPGPSIYYQCLTCKKTIEISTINSGNNLGARYWTDGYMIASMLPSEFRLIKCPHCKALFWGDDLRKLGEVDWGEGESKVQKEWGKIKYAIGFDANDYIFAIENSFARNKKEKEYLRIHAWWEFNHTHRWPINKFFFTFNRKPAPAVNANVFQNNLIALQEILNLNVQSERLLLAEIARELGQFEKCTSLLDFEFDDSLIYKKEFIFKCCEEKNAIVQDMTDYLEVKYNEEKEEYTRLRNKYIKEGINFVKTQAIAKGIATEDNFYSAVQNLSVKDFVRLRGDYKDLHTLHFPKPKQ